MAVQLQFTPNYAFGSGVFAPGAQARFSESSTTTPLTVYADESLTTPHPTPLLADANGRFPTVWGATGQNYKVVVSDASGAAIYTIDKVALGSVSVGSAGEIGFDPQPDNAATNVQDAIENNSTAITGLGELSALDRSDLEVSGADFNAGTSNTEGTISPAKLNAKIEDQVPGELNASGSAPLFACRAWVNFNGTGGASVRASGNVASVVRDSVGLYTITFTTAMEDANYAVSVGSAFADTRVTSGVNATPTASSVQVYTGTASSNTRQDRDDIFVSVFR